MLTALFTSRGYSSAPESHNNACIFQKSSLASVVDIQIILQTPGLLITKDCENHVEI